MMNRAEWENMMNEVDQYIMNLQNASRSVGELFYDTISIETIEIFTNYLTGFYDIALAISVTVENSEPFIPGLKDKVSSHVTELFSYFEEMKKFLSQDRYVMLADLLKYEVPDRLKTLSVALKGFRTV